MATRNRRSFAAGDAFRRLAGPLGRSLAVALRFAGLPLAAAAIYAAGVWCLWQHAAADAARPCNPGTDAAACRWLSPTDVAELNDAVKLGPDRSLYDRDLCSAVAARYRESPWVERVVSVRRSFPDQVVVSLAVREPLAYVRCASGLVLVDRRGVRLPTRAARGAERNRPVVEGVHGSVPAVGAPWPGRALADALRLTEIVGEVTSGGNPGLRLTAVEVRDEQGSVDGLPQMTARTASGMVIDWGSLNDSSSYLYPSVGEKREELQRALRSLGDPAAIESVMVRYRGCSVKPRESFPAAGAPAGPAANLAEAGRH